MKSLRVLIGAAMFLVASSAQAAITFEDVPTQNFASPILSGGFTFEFSGGWMVGPGPLGGFSFPDNGTSRLVTLANSIVTFSIGDSSPFSLSQVSAAAGETNLAPGTITLTGNLAGGGTVQQVLNVTSVFQTFLIDPSFTNLSSIVVTGASGIGLDDLVVNESVVPEPASVSLVLVGLGICGAVSRRRRS